MIKVIFADNVSMKTLCVFRYLFAFYISRCSYTNVKDTEINVCFFSVDDCGGYKTL